MPEYTAPLQEIQFALNEIAGMGEITALDYFEEVTPDLQDAVLEEAGKLAANVFAPLNQEGDKQGAHIVDGKVQVPAGFQEAYSQFSEGGWMGLAHEEKYGGQGLPFLLRSSVFEMYLSANMAFSLNPMLSDGAIKALVKHGTDQLKDIYLPKMISGSWTGTMDLTEPNAGSDLSSVLTKATPTDRSDSSGKQYLIEGQKIYITWGDHEMTENVIHLVLARLKDAPEGIKGISLFLVPKYLANEDGSVGERNDLQAVSLEHKLGIHASPTCMISFGDSGRCIGYLVGRENEGLSHMFTMMNEARLGVGMQGVSISERAYQQARRYATERIQGFAEGHEGRVAIIHHPDVRRMLMLMRSLTEASRAISYVAAAHTDFAEKSTDPEQIKLKQERLDLLVPIAKGWCTEIAQETTSLGLQIHGGMGFIEETGAAQYVRDARIITIYEGTTGIQGLDLVGRKILRDKGVGIQRLLNEIEIFVDDLKSESTDSPLSNFREPLVRALQTATQSTSWLLTEGVKDPNNPGSASVNLLMLLGTVLGGYYMVKSAKAAQNILSAGEIDVEFYQTKIATAHFYLDHVLPRSNAFLEMILAGSNSIMELKASSF